MFHKPTGETWTVAYAEGDWLAPCGWPAGLARVRDCTLIEECSEKESLALLRELAEMQGGRTGHDHRKSYAQARLRELGLLPLLPPTDAEQLARLRAAIAEHHAQKADDRCIEDDDRLYAAAGLPPCDRRVGDKAAMLANCARFIERRCEGGGWPTYVEVEGRLETLKRGAQRYLEATGFDHVTASADGQWEAGNALWGLIRGGDA